MPSSALSHLLFLIARARRYARIATPIILLLTCLSSTLSATTLEVQPGDTLWKIAVRELGNGQRWKEIAEINRLEPPYAITSGSHIAIPERTAPERIAARAVGDRERPIVEDQAESAHSTASAVAIPGAPPVFSAYLRPQSPDPATNPISLEEAVALALKRNIALRSGLLDPRTARSNMEVARSAFDPVLSADGDQSWARTRSSTGRITDNNRTTVSAGVGQTLPPGTSYDVTVSGSRDAITPAGVSTFNPSYTNEVTVTVTQPLLEGAGRSVAYADVDIAHERLAAANMRAVRLAVTTAAEIEAAYWTLAEAQAAERVAHSSLAVAEDLLARNERLLQLELIASVEVLTARAAVAARREALISANVDRLRAADQLLFALYGEDARSEPLRPWAVSDPTMLAEPGNEADLELKALDKREDLEAARRDLAASGIQLRSSTNALLPNLDLRGSVGTGSTAGTLGRSWDGTVSNEEPSWSLGLALTFPFGNRADRAREESARIDLERRRLQAEALANAIRLDVRNARRDVVLGLEKVAAAEIARSLADERLTAEQKRLDLGLGDTIRVLDAEEAASRAHLQELSNRYGLASAAARLRAALGVPGPNALLMTGVVR